MTTDPNGAGRGPTDTTRENLFRKNSEAGDATVRDATGRNGTGRDTGRIDAAPSSVASAPTVPTPTPSTTADDRGGLRGQKARFGGIRWGAAFFGWLTAVGTAVLLTGLLTAVGGALGAAVIDNGRQAADQAGQALQNPGAAPAAGITAAVVVAAILLVAYYCGGYVAGRMSRFSGARQGVAVWVWTIVITALAAILTAVAGSRFGALNGLGGLRLPVDPTTLGVAGIIAAVVALVVSLVGAVLGGLAGMRYHRKIDRAA